MPGLAMDADPDFHLGSTQGEGGALRVRNRHAVECDAHRPDPRAQSVSEPLQRLKRHALLGTST
ncbi:hypothetical protein D3C87_2196490 [compost metagenome]